MSYYIIRLDDACEKRDIEKWNRMEALLDRYSVKPIVGIIPCCQDKDMEKYPVDADFWNRAKLWQGKGWVMALHGYSHVFCTNEGGINPVNNYSEFAGVPLEKQEEKIAKGVQVLKEHGITPKVFFAPAHTFDENTIEALKKCSDIRIISDTVANAPYRMLGIVFVPQQSGHVRNLPFKVVTFCYHPNNMVDADYIALEKFITKNEKKIIKFPLDQVKNEIGVKDLLIRNLYFLRKQITMKRMRKIKAQKIYIWKRIENSHGNKCGLCK